MMKFIISGCKGNAILCGRNGCHPLHMNGLCRDCNVSPMDGDNTYIGSHLKCKYTAVSDIGGQTDDHSEQYSCLPIDNCFTRISFGGYPRGIYGGTPAEISHAALFISICG